MISKIERVLECERALLGCLILNPHVVANVKGSLKPECFQEKKHRDIFGAICKLDDKGASVDFTSIINENAAIEPFYISELTNDAAMPSSIQYYTNEVKTAYTLRECSRISTEIKDAVKQIAVNPTSDSDSVKQLLADSQKAIFALSNNITNAKIYNMRDLVIKEVEYINKCLANKREYLGYETGISNLDRIIDGLQSVYMVIGARPSMGKTALAQKIALNLTRQKVKTLFIELEMSPQQLTERYISLMANIPFSKIRNGFMTTATCKAVQAKMDELSRNEYFIPAECSNRQLDDIMNLCRAQVRTNGVKAIFIDHIGLIRLMNNSSPAYEKARIISNSLQQLQRELNVPIVALSQLSRGAEDTKKPELNEFRGSGAIEEDADVCILIGRERANDETQTSIPALLAVRKNRNGSVGNAKTLFYPQTVNFVDWKETKSEAREAEREANM